MKDIRKIVSTISLERAHRYDQVPRMDVFPSFKFLARFIRLIIVQGQGCRQLVHLLYEAIAFPRNIMIRAGRESCLSTLKRSRGTTYKRNDVPLL